MHIPTSLQNLRPCQWLQHTWQRVWDERDNPSLSGVSNTTYWRAWWTCRASVPRAGLDRKRAQAFNKPTIKCHFELLNTHQSNCIIIQSIHVHIEKIKLMQLQWTLRFTLLVPSGEWIGLTGTVTNVTEMFSNTQFSVRQGALQDTTTGIGLYYTQVSRLGPYLPLEASR